VIAFFNTLGIFHKGSDTFFIGDEYPSVVSKQHSRSEISWRGRLFQILTEDYIKKGIPPTLSSEARTIIKSLGVYNCSQDIFLAKRLGHTRKVFRDHLAEMAVLPNPPNADFKKGFTDAQVAQVQICEQKCRGCPIIFSRRIPLPVRDTGMYHLGIVGITNFCISDTFGLQWY
jgi:hypothetical protein